MSRKKKPGCIAAGIVFAGVVILIAFSVWYIKIQYKDKQDIIRQALSELPDFDNEEAGKKIALKLGVAYPVPGPVLTSEQITSEAETEAEADTKERYPSSLFTKQQDEIFRKYKQSQDGDNVSFLLETTGKTITGIFKGRFEDHKGRFIKVDFNEYRIPDIIEEHQYLFIEGLAAQKAIKKNRELKVDFDNDRNIYRKKQENAILENLYEKNGYANKNAVWLPNIEIFQSLLDEKKSDFEKTLEKDKKTIYRKNKLFGIIEIDYNSEPFRPGGPAEAGNLKP